MDSSLTGNSSWPRVMRSIDINGSIHCKRIEFNHLKKTDQQFKLIETSAFQIKQEPIEELVESVNPIHCQQIRPKRPIKAPILKSLLESAIITETSAQSSPSIFTDSDSNYDISIDPGSVYNANYGQTYTEEDLNYYFNKIYPICLVCRRVFKTASSLTFHSPCFRSSTDGINFNCLFCHRLVENAVDFMIHLGTSHPSIHLYECLICGHRTGRADESIDHLNIIHFNNGLNLDQPIYDQGIELRALFKCPIEGCPKNSKGILFGDVTSHLSRFHGPVGSNVTTTQGCLLKYNCPIEGCYATPKIKGDMKRHIRTCHWRIIDVDTFDFNSLRAADD